MLQSNHADVGTQFAKIDLFSLCAVKWIPDRTGHSYPDNCAVSKYSGMHTVSK